MYVESCKEIAGHHTMIIAVGTGSDVDSMISQFHKAVMSAPLSTSACLLVPHWPKASFDQHLKGLPLLSEYPACRDPCKVSYQVTVCSPCGGGS
jgi:hypothetical protein